MEADRPIPELPTEIIFSHILPRLPPYILMRYKLVCKSWSSIIRSPFFVTAYRNFPRRRTNLLFKKLSIRGPYPGFFWSQIDQKGNPSRVAELFKLPNSCGFFPIVHGTNGLLCVTMAPLDQPVYISNPSTGESIQLPHVRLRKTYGEGYASARYFFGFSPLTNEYKVLQIVTIFYAEPVGTCRDFVFNIFTLGTDSWRPLQIDLGELPFDIAHLGSTSYPGSDVSVCLNGAIHWMYQKQNSIAVFDVGDETFRVIPLPQDYDGHESPQDYDYDDPNGYGTSRTYTTVPRIVEVGGCVGVFHDKSWEQNVMELWILKDYQHHVWVKETIPLMSTLTRDDFDGGCSWIIDALCTIHTGELALVVVHLGFSPGYDDSEPQLHLYNMKTKQYIMLDFSFPKEAINSSGEEPLFLITSYEDSIVPLN